MRLIKAFLLLCTPLVVGGCGGVDGVDVNLPFVGNIMEKSKATEKKMATRGALILPPTVQGLPEPANKQANTEANWPVDPEQKAKSDAQIAALKQKQYEKDGDWKGERKSGNALDDFKDKIDWSRRQTGIFKKLKGEDAQE